MDGWRRVAPGTPRPARRFAPRIDVSRQTIARAAAPPDATLAVMQASRETPRNRRPRRVAARVLRAPVLLYEHGWGRLLGHRFLARTHRGRSTGRRYVTVLEVVAWPAEATEAVVVSGFGPTAQWYRNLLAGGGAEVRIGQQRFHARARALDDDEAVAVLAGYERRNGLPLRSYDAP
jgi:deazaflavin-dependent oxidoreductase (nitroreductase family)